MAIDRRVELEISNLVRSQFPDFYQEHGRLFVEFVVAYYEWMETTGQSLYHARRQLDYKDVDATADEFLTHFTQKYLSGIQFETESNVREMVKHSLDVYRTKGTERSIDLLFRLVYGAGATVYYPEKDILRASAGKWVEPLYLEVGVRGEPLASLVGFQIEGVTSGATAFVERATRKKGPHHHVDVLFVSSLRGHFVTGEVVNRTSSPLTVSECPVVIGSLSSAEVLDGGYGYSVGDVVPITSTTGYGASARVAETTAATGVVSATLVDGGFGFTANAQVLISDVVASVDNVTMTTPEMFYFLEEVRQEIASVEYEAANGDFTVGSNVYVYDGGGNVLGVALLTSLSTVNATDGVMTLSVLSGNVEGGPFYSVSNAVTANQTSYDLDVAEYKVLGTDKTFVVLTGTSGNFTPGETVVANGGTSTATVVSHVGASLTVSGVSGVLVVGDPIVGSESGTTSTVESFRINLGLMNDSGSLVAGDFSYARLDPDGDNFPFRVFRKSDGSGFSMEVVALSNTESVNLVTDELADYVSTDLDGLYDFPAEPSANANTIIDDCLTVAEYDVGRVSMVAVTGAGNNYSSPPVVRIYEPVTHPFGKTDYRLVLDDADGDFAVGEIITQDTTGALGLVETGATSTGIERVQRMSFASDFEIGYVITGSQSGTTANVTAVFDLSRGTLDLNVTGSDASVSANTTVANGSVTLIDVIDSGFGFADLQTVSFESPGKGQGLARLSVSREGKSAGYYKKRGGELSGTKKLFDGYYYQDFSYEVRSSVVLKKYVDMLKRVLHVAGTKMFGSMVTDSRIDSVVTVSSTVTQSNT